MKKAVPPLTAFFVTSISVFSFLDLVNGKVFGFMDTSLCLRYVGCNAGFFGYDALIHFLGGIAIAMSVVWVAERSPKHNFFHEHFWKSCVVLIAIVALVGVAWEMLEFGYDRVRADLLHRDIMHPNTVAQPSNSDTIGDLMFDLVGAAAVATLLWFSGRKHLTV